MTQPTTSTPTAVAAPQTPGAVLAKPMSIKDTVIAQFREAEDGLKAMAEKYRNVVYDVTTTKGMNEAKAARAELRDDGRRLLTRTAAKVKADVNELKEVMGTEVERLIAIVKPVEDSIDAQIKVEEKRKADEKEARDATEATRVAAHRANIAQLHGYAEDAEGKPLETLKGAIVKLGELEFGPEWEEFAQDADAARLSTISRLKSLVAQEEQRIENEHLRAQLAALKPLAAPEPEPKQMPALEEQAPEAIKSIAKSTHIIDPAASQAGIPFAVDAWDDPNDGAEALPMAAVVADAVLLGAGFEVAGIGTVRRAAPAATYATREVAEAHDDGSRISLGQIKERIAPMSIDAAGLETLGFKHVSTGGAAKLYRACDLPAIRDAMVKHLLSITF